MFQIPSGIMSKYHEAMNELITNPITSERCTLIYPPRKVECECVGIQGQNTSHDMWGQPNIFGNDCPMCGGTQYKEVADEEIINLNVYPNKMSWKKFGSILMPEDTDVLVRGFISDMPKIQQCQYIEIFSDFQDKGLYRCSKAGPPIFHGFENKYFLGFLKIS